jgi:hypothetical protein
MQFRPWWRSRAERSTPCSTRWRPSGFRDDELQEAGAIGIYDTPGDLAKALDDTPLA